MRYQNCSQGPPTCDRVMNARSQEPKFRPFRARNSGGGKNSLLNGSFANNDSIMSNMPLDELKRTMKHPPATASRSFNKEKNGIGQIDVNLPRGGQRQKFQNTLTQPSREKQPGD